LRQGQRGLTSPIMDATHLPSFWTAWTSAPQITIPLLVGEYLYLRAMVARRDDQANRERRFFLAGLGGIALVVITPIGVHSADYFWCHMIQHVTLMMIAGPLLVLGTPSTFHPKNRIFETLTNPLISWILYATVMIGVHLPGPHVFIVQRPWVHNWVEVPLYFIVAYLFYFNLLDRNLVRRRVSPAMSVIALFLMMVPETLTGFFIYVSPHSLYQGMFTLDDQRRGGSIMWSGGMIIDAIWIAFAVFHWIKSEERASIAVDAEIAAGQVKE
jgi:cytochrome c oxidase assembly factor CtaG